MPCIVTMSGRAGPMYKWVPVAAGEEAGGSSAEGSSDGDAEPVKGAPSRYGSGAELLRMTHRPRALQRALFECIQAGVMAVTICRATVRMALST